MSQSEHSFATEQVELRHDFDSEEFAQREAYWRSDSSGPFVELSMRPEREEDEDALIRICEQDIPQIYFGWDDSRHLRQLRLALQTPATQLGAMDARKLWLLFTHEKRFDYQFISQFGEDAIHARLQALDVTHAVSEERMQRELRLFYDMFMTQRSNSDFYTQAPLAGLAALIIGPEAACRIWQQVVPVTRRGAIFDYIVQGDEQAEAAIAQMVREERADDAPWSRYLVSSLLRVPDEERLRACLEASYDATMGATRTPREVARRAGGIRAWIQWLERSRQLDTPFESRYIYVDEYVVQDYVIARDFEALGRDLTDIPRYLSGFIMEAYIKRVLQVHHHELVAPMLSLYDRPIIGRYAREWLLHEGANAVHGLAMALEETRRARRVRALELLRHYQMRGDEAIIEAGLQGLPASVLDAYDKLVRAHRSATAEEVDPADRPGWLVALTSDKSLSRKRLPGFIDELPAVYTWHGARLPQDDVVLLCKILKESSLAQPHEAIAQFQGWLDARSASELAIYLYRAWTRDRAKSTHKWALWSLAFLGDAQIPEILHAEIPKWPGVRANWGVGVLAWLGTPEATRVLFSFANRRKQNALWRHSNNGLRTIAKKRGVRLEVLEDEAVPDCGFDEQGSRLFDYGERKFWLRLDDQLKPRFFDQQKHKYVNALPRITKVDDPIIAEQSRAEYARDKKLLQTTVKQERARFAQMLESRRVWEARHWERAMCHNPLLNHFATRLLWYGDLVDEDGETSRAAFRLLQDGTLADIEDETVKLAEEARISLLHPALISHEDLMRWVELLTDYEIVQPIDQLTTPSHHFDEIVEQGVIRARLPDTKLPEYPVLSDLGRSGWEYNAYGSDPHFVYKSYPDHQITAICEIDSDGSDMFDRPAWPLQLRFVSWAPDPYEPVVETLYSYDESFDTARAHIRDADPVPLPEVEAGVLSESFDEILKAWT